MPSRAILVVLATVMINMTGVGLVWPILPKLVGELSTGSFSHVALVNGAIAVIFSIMQFVFAPVFGALSDRFGRRPVMLIALAGLGLDNLLLALAPSLFWMFAGRALGGIFGATFSVANAYMADLSSDKDRAAAFGMVGAAFGVGFVLGPAIGGLLGEVDIRLPFWVAAGFSFLNLGFGWLFLEETLPAEKRRNFSVGELNPFAALRWLVRQPAMLPLALALFIANTMQRGLEAIWVLFTGLQYGWGAREAGISLAVVGLSYVFVQGFLVRKTVARFGELATMTGGFLLSAVIYALLCVNTSGLIGFIGIVPHVIGWGLAGPALQALASQQVDARQQGYLQGGLSAISGLAAILGPAASSSILAWFTSPAAPFEFPGAFFAFGMLALCLAAWMGAQARAKASTGQ